MPRYFCEERQGLVVPILPLGVMPFVLRLVGWRTWCDQVNLLSSSTVSVTLFYCLSILYSPYMHPILVCKADRLRTSLRLSV